MMDAVPPDKRVPHNTDTTSLDSFSPGPPKSSDQCEGCRSVSSDHPGFISYDDKAVITYISAQYPEQPQLYSVVRQACVRSLNCEVCPGREGPIVFGEDGASHVLSHTFNLKDAQARGFRRLYSFIVVMMDRVFLINSWPFLVKHFRALIDDLQAKAEGVFTQESGEIKGSRSLRSSVSSLSGPDHLRRIRTPHTGRSLVEVTGETEIFAYLHKYFVFLLKAGGQRVTESVLEGPPQVMATPQPTQAGGDNTMEPLSQEEMVKCLNKPLTSTEFTVVKETGQPAFYSLRHMLKVIGKSDFLELAYHVVRGDQVIVRGSDITTVTSILNLLKELVPDVCCRIVGFSVTYQESFHCNFLGLSVGVELPAHVVASEHHILLDILPPLTKPSTSPQPSASDSDLLGQYKLMVYSALPRVPEQKYPLYLQRVLSVLTGEVLSEIIITKALSNLKEEWMNKVKVLYKFSQMGYLDVPQKNDHLSKLLNEILLVPQEELSVLQYWRTALSKEYKEHLKKNDTIM